MPGNHDSLPAREAENRILYSYYQLASLIGSPTGKDVFSIGWSIMIICILEKPFYAITISFFS
jgi:hypothetical protein